MDQNGLHQVFDKKTEELPRLNLTTFPEFLQQLRTIGFTEEKLHFQPLGQNGGILMVGAEDSPRRTYVHISIDEKHGNYSITSIDDLNRAKHPPTVLQKTPLSPEELRETNIDTKNYYKFFSQLEELLIAHHPSKAFPIKYRIGKFRGREPLSPPQIDQRVFEMY